MFTPSVLTILGIILVLRVGHVVRDRRGGPGTGVLVDGGAHEERVVLVRQPLVLP